MTDATLPIVDSLPKHPLRPNDLTFLADSDGVVGVYVLPQDLFSGGVGDVVVIRQPTDQRLNLYSLQLVGPTASAPLNPDAPPVTHQVAWTVSGYYGDVAPVQWSARGSVHMDSGQPFGEYIDVTACVTGVTWMTPDPDTAGMEIQARELTPRAIRTVRRLHADDGGTFTPTDVTLSATFGPEYLPDGASRVAAERIAGPRFDTLLGALADGGLARIARSFAWSTSDGGTDGYHKNPYMDDHPHPPGRFPRVRRPTPDS